MGEPVQGGIYRVLDPKARARELLVVSEDDWNVWATDSVVVPLYPADELAENSLRPAIIPRRGVADCTRLISMPHEQVGNLIEQCSPVDLAAVRQGIGVFLCVTDLRRARLTGPSPSVTHWYPHQHRIYHANPIDQRSGKMYAVLTEDEHWNSVQNYVVTVRLTSVGKPARSTWESPVQGGYVCAGNLFALEHPEVARRPPSPPRPQALAAHEKVALAHGLTRLLTLP